MQENNNALDIHAAEEPRGKYAVVGVRFRSCGKVYTFQAEDLELLLGARVIVESDMGLSIGSVAAVKYTAEKPQESLKKVIRIATEKDFETVQTNRSFQEEARTYCVGRVKELDLPMKIVTTETTLDRKRLVFYFTADGRIDFRELVRDLAAKFKTRIEMRQIGVRDEVKLLGGIGICGRQTCCSLFLTNFEPVTIKMAKRQDLSINQSKLSGICGRLMCCLGYECRDASAGERGPAAVQEDELITIAEGSAEAGLQQTDSGAVVPEGGLGGGSQPAADTRERRDKIQQPELQRKEQGPGHQPDRSERRERHSRRNRHRHRKQAQGQQDKPSQEKPSQEGAPKLPEGENKGKAFSRRRKFWKRKKQQP
ncbi:MAG: stage 0 sporulation protein [Nitrospiraceae bacterium]|nr:MAG: stage 0 sporulation protein [Nitrospiraceae bacterium]